MNKVRHLWVILDLLAHVYDNLMRVDVVLIDLRIKLAELEEDVHDMTFIKKRDVQ